MAKSSNGGGWLGILVAVVGAIHVAHQTADDLEWLAAYCAPCRLRRGDA